MGMVFFFFFFLEFIQTILYNFLANSLCLMQVQNMTFVFKMVMFYDFFIVKTKDIIIARDSHESIIIKYHALKSNIKLKNQKNKLNKKKIFYYCDAL